MPIDGKLGEKASVNATDKNVITKESMIERCFIDFKKHYFNDIPTEIDDTKLKSLVGYCFSRLLFIHYCCHLGSYVALFNYFNDVQYNQDDILNKNGPSEQYHILNDDTRKFLTKLYSELSPQPPNQQSSQSDGLNPDTNVLGDDTKQFLSKLYSNLSAQESDQQSSPYDVLEMMRDNPETEPVFLFNLYSHPTFVNLNHRIVCDTSFIEKIKVLVPPVKVENSEFFYINDIYEYEKKFIEKVYNPIFASYGHHELFYNHIRYIVANFINKDPIELTKIQTNLDTVTKNITYMDLNERKKKESERLDNQKKLLRKKKKE